MYTLFVHRKSEADDLNTFTQTLRINEALNSTSEAVLSEAVLRLLYACQILPFFRSRNSFLTGVYPFRVGLSVSLIVKLANILSIS